MGYLPGAQGAPLLPAVGVRPRHEHLHLETPRAQQRAVDELRPVGHANHEDVVQLLHAVHLGE